MILIKNNQRKIKLNIAAIQADIAAILSYLKYTDFDIGILFTTPQSMQVFNNDYRGYDKPTDILSFAHHPFLKTGERIKVLGEEDKNLGDLILCPHYILEHLEQWNMSFEQRLKVLLVHGICHLLGYDHIVDSDYEIMKEQEKLILKIF